MYRRLYVTCIIKMITCTRLSHKLSVLFSALSMYAEVLWTTSDSSKCTALPGGRDMKLTFICSHTFSTTSCGKFCSKLLILLLTNLPIISVKWYKKIINAHRESNKQSRTQRLYQPNQPNSFPFDQLIDSAKAVLVVLFGPYRFFLLSRSQNTIISVILS